MAKLVTCAFVDVVRIRQTASPSEFYVRNGQMLPLRILFRVLYQADLWDQVAVVAVGLFLDSSRGA